MEGKEGEDAEMDEAEDEGGDAAGKKAEAAKASKGKAKGKGGESSSAAKESMGGLKEAIAAAKLFIRHDRERTGAIVKRERAMRSRSTMLLAPSVKSFPVVSQPQLQEAQQARARRQGARGPQGRSAQGPGSSAAAVAAAAASSSTAAAAKAPVPPDAIAVRYRLRRPRRLRRPAAAARRFAAGAPPRRFLQPARAVLVPRQQEPVGYIIVPPALTAIAVHARALFERNEFTSGVEVKRAAPKSPPSN